MRFFRSTAAVYEGICQQLDAAYGYPNEATKTLRTLPPAEVLPKGDDGRVYLAIAAEYCEFNLPSEMLPQLISAGLVDEISEAEYLSVLPEWEP